MSSISWRKNEIHNGFRLDLEFKIDNKSFTGAIFCTEVWRGTDELSVKKNAYFRFQSLGIANKKIDINQSEEEMKKEALDFLQSKLTMRISELTAMNNLINK